MGLTYDVLFFKNKSQLSLVAEFAKLKKIKDY